MKRIWLEALRKEKHMTHKDVAEKINVSRQYYGMIENGERDPSVATAKKIASLFDVEWTIFFENNRYKTLHNNVSKVI